MARYPVLLVLNRCLQNYGSEMRMDQPDTWGGPVFVFQKTKPLVVEDFIDYERLEIFEFGARSVSICEQINSSASS
jgi:hypothetical protein